MKKKLLSLLLVLLMVLGMIPMSALAADAPFTATVEGVEITDITEETLSWTSWSGATSDVTCYKVAVPEGSSEATLVFESEKQWSYYDSKGNYVGAGDTSWTSAIEHTVAIQDSNGDGEIDGISVQEPNAYSTEYYIMFVYPSAGGEVEDPETPETVIPDGAPFTAITADAEGAITVTENEAVGFGSYTDISYYHVIVPAGATKVYVTYTAETEFYLYNEATYAYKVSLPDLTQGYASGSFPVATNDDGTKTATIPVEAYVLTDGAGSGIALESPTFAPVNLFTFEYEAGECEHAWDEGEVTKDPTCTEAGERTFTCTKGCGETKTETVSATGHTWGESVVTTEPTCEGTGVRTSTCENGCGETQTRTIAALGHAWGEGEVTTEPTCEEAGVRTFTCGNCGGTKTEEEAALGHNYVDGACTNCYEADPRPEQIDGVFQLADADDLLWFAEYVAEGNTSISAALTADIDMTGKEWSGIGTSTYKFSGTFDGGNHKVTFSNQNGLFFYAYGTSNTQLANVKNVIIEGTVNVAGVALNAQRAVFENCINRAEVTGTGINAGIVANTSYVAWNDLSAYVTIKNCANEGNVTSSSAGPGYQGVGGILGSGNGVVISNCSNTGDVSGSNAGGIAGYLQGSKTAGSVTNCYNTGKISGSNAGGLVGSMHNGTSVTNSYNAGEATYAIAGELFNTSSTISNTTYWLVTKSTQATPANYSGSNSGIVVSSSNAVSVTAAEMASDEFVTLLGAENFQQSCPAPVLSWQEAKEHDMREIPNVGTICLNCGLGTKNTFDVTLESGTGYTVSGETSVEEGADYTFTVTIADGYEKSEGFKVYVNGTLATSETDTYTVENVSGPLKVIVSGVSKIPDSYDITLPKTGNGYKVNIVGGETTVARNGEYKFTVSFANGFKAGKAFAVFVNGKEVEANDGVYTVSNVNEAQVITVEGTEMIPYEGTVTVNFTITEGLDSFYVANNGTVIAQEEFEVPYFDLELYDLERYYYNPYCYVDKDGNAVNQTPGTKETAYGVITVMHAYIYATEVYYLGMDPADAGKGFADEDAKAAFEEAIYWSGGAGSSFMFLWGDGSNLNYYVNYVYPLGREEWGSTSDQIPMEDNDIISIHFIKSNASGSNYGFFVADDDNTSYDVTDTIESKTVTQGDEITLTMYNAGAAGNYLTGYSRMKDQQLFWIDGNNLSENIYDWNYHKTDKELAEGEVNLNFANLTSDQLVTDENGNITFDTSYLEPGTYYIASKGGISAGGMVDSQGFVSRGNEAGPALFKLVVEGAESDVLLGDVNGDDSADISDVQLLFEYVLGITSVSDEQIMAGNVNGDSVTDISDVQHLFEYVLGIITEL